MTFNQLSSVRSVLVICLLVSPASLLWADGGAVRISERAGSYQVTVFTSPTPLCAGPVDISVLVLDADTGEQVPGAQVKVRLTARSTAHVFEHQATAAAATNKLFYAAQCELPASGWWDADVSVKWQHGSAVVRFGFEADEAPPRWRELWPWFTWPAVAVALFGIHQVLGRTRDQSTPPHMIVREALFH